MTWLVTCRGLMAWSVVCGLNGLVVVGFFVGLASRAWLCGLFVWLSFL